MYTLVAADVSHLAEGKSFLKSIIGLTRDATVRLANQARRSLAITGACSEPHGLLDARNGFFISSPLQTISSYVPICVLIQPYLER